MNRDHGSSDRGTSALHRLVRRFTEFLPAKGATQPPVRAPEAAAAGTPPSSFLPGEAAFSFETGMAGVTPERAWLLEALSERMLRHHSSSSWRKLFLDPRRQDDIKLEQGKGIYVCAQLQDRNMVTDTNVQSELALVAASHRAEVDPWPSGDLLMCFQDPATALEAAVDLQQLVGGVRVQVGISSGPRSIAVIDAGGTALRVSLGHAVDSAARASRMAPAGTIRMEAGMYELLHDEIVDLPRCVVTTEFDGEGHEESVSLVMAPRASEAQSTFAGLGRI